MKLKPLHDWALIQSIEPEEKTAGGIIIPETAKDKPTEGIVLAIGPGKYEAEKGKEKDKEKKKFVPTTLKPGQRIIYGKYSAREFDLNGETLTLVREEDVLGIVEETQLAVKKKTEVMSTAAPQNKKKSSASAAKKRKTAEPKGRTKK